MNKPKDPCAVCPFIRDCIAEGEDKRWCFVRILTLEAWDWVAQRRKQELDERYGSLGSRGKDRVTRSPRVAFARDDRDEGNDGPPRASAPTEKDGGGAE